VRADQASTCFHHAKNIEGGSNRPPTIGSGRYVTSLHAVAIAPSAAVTVMRKVQLGEVAARTIAVEHAGVRSSAHQLTTRCSPVFPLFDPRTSRIGIVHRCRSDSATLP
jgi:hypothetical protein